MALSRAWTPSRRPTRRRAQVAAFDRGIGVVHHRARPREATSSTKSPAAAASRRTRSPPPEEGAQGPRGRGAAPGAKARAAAAKAPKAPHAGPGNFAAIREAAERGELPPVPDFSADLHKRNRGRLAQLVAMAEAGDVAGLEAFPISPELHEPEGDGPLSEPLRGRPQGPRREAGGVTHHVKTKRTANRPCADLGADRPGTGGRSRTGAGVELNCPDHVYRQNRS